ncbi:MAG TPA: ZIP family metal transporter [Woeseiaceae bacterium]|nr:ZIP family metal transporter [Woeseiaceae bacterium]
MPPPPDWSPIALGALGSLLAGLGTTVGAIPALAVRRLEGRVRDVMLGFAAGVMLAASFFSLILPALGAAAGPDGRDAEAVVVVSLGILLGAAALWSIHAFVPHEHFIMGREGPDTERLRRIWLFVIAITLHNIPEGLAVGVGFGGGDLANGVPLALGIGLQNVPEGAAIALALRTIGYSRTAAFLVTSATGLVEPLAGLAGITAVSSAEFLLPWGLAFAAGAMIFVISSEVIPETHRHGAEAQGTAGLMAGFVVMMCLDVAIG